MATISQIPYSLSFSSFHYRKPLIYLHHHHQPQHFVSYLNSTKKHSLVCFACSIKQTRVRKRVKSNEDLRSEIVEFVALNGFPEDHVPSMKELSAHGRVDLANIVRRRGYKFIRELLANSETDTSMETSSSDCDICFEDSPTGQGKEALDAVDDHLSTELPLSTEISFIATEGSMTFDQEEDVITNSRPEAEEHGSLSKDESSLAGVSSIENSLYNMDDSNRSGEMTENSLKIESVEMELHNRANIENSSSETSISTNYSLVLDDISSYSDREADNDLMSEDEDVNNVMEDSSLTYGHYTSQDLNYIKQVDIATESLSALTSENTMANPENFQSRQIADMAENRSDNADDNDWMLGLSSSSPSMEEKTTRFIQNGYLDIVDDHENDIPNESSPEETKDNVETTKGDGNQRSLSMLPNGHALAMEEVNHATEVNSFDRNMDQRDGSADMGNDSHDEAMKRENQVEITRLRFMLRQKELELSRLKEQIEKEKLSLSVLQRKAETEIQKAQMRILEKDVELQEAEGSLSGLQEVEIEYCGNGNVVEVTGSFNGWEHRVGMELQTSKSIGKHKCWSVLLWLYPGTYEIKFIVDGHWTTDPLKDSITRGHITNNILKVDR